MSEHGIHVHAPHDHAVEHQAHHGPGLGQYVAIFTAVLATIAAIVGYHVSTTLNEAMLFKNEAVLLKAEASDQWGYYQAKSTKGHIVEIASHLARGSTAERYRQQIEKYEQEKRDIKRDAEALDAKSRAASERSEHLMRPLHRAEQAMTLLQIAISLASITALTRKRWLFGIAGLAAAGGLVLAGVSFVAA
jgi:hypothetical protein